MYQFKNIKSYALCHWGSFEKHLLRKKVSSPFELALLVVQLCSGLSFDASQIANTLGFVPAYLGFSGATSRIGVAFAFLYKFC
jgi:hypothetical protein